MPLPSFNYDEAFSCNRGLLTADEQARLRRAVIAIPGMGGVGGIHLLTLLRLGIERFSIADGDTFELRNLNRQVGATMETLGRPKTEVMAEMARAINPAASIRILQGPVQASNVDSFLSQCDAVIDSLDFFCIDARRLLFAHARRLGLPVITCGPLGFSAASLTFLPQGPSFDEFMDIRDDMETTEQLMRFAVGLAPAGLHVPYLDPSSVDLQAQRGPSSIIGVTLCAAVAADELMNLLLRRRPVRSVPHYTQFDAYRQRYIRGMLVGGNRHPAQRLKLWYLKRRLQIRGTAARRGHE